MDRNFMLFGLTATSTRALRCVEDVSDEESRQSLYRLSPIIWQLGHLALADDGFLKRAGGALEIPGSYRELFATGTGGIAEYPSLAEVRSVFEIANRALEEVARGADLAQALDARNYKTIGEMLVFAAYHRGYHIGKMTTLRALIGKPRLFG